MLSQYKGFQVIRNDSISMDKYFCNSACTYIAFWYETEFALKYYYVIGDY